MRRFGAEMPTSARRSSARCLACRRRHVEVRRDRLDQLPSDRVQRVERSQRVLEDRADLTAAHTTHRLGRQIVDAPAIEQHLPGADAAGRVDQSDDRRAGQRFARAGFADDAEDLAWRDGKRHVVHRDQQAAARRKLDPEALDREQRHLLQSRIERVAQPVAQQVDREHHDHQRRSGKDGDPPFAREQEIVADAYQRAQRRLRRRHAYAEERQASLR